jgi:hypothetical protein
MKTIAATLLIVACAFPFTDAQEKVMKEMYAIKVSQSDVPGRQAEKDFPSATPFAYFIQQPFQ